MRELYGRRRDTMRSAVEAGVPVFAGTDAGGVLDHGLVAQEIAELTNIGMTPTQALAAGSWAAREWLGVPGELTVGAPADLIVYGADPRKDPAVLAHPTRILLRGNVIA
jgi:imidazolonepropionase-like amidohydrolase